MTNLSLLNLFLEYLSAVTWDIYCHTDTLRDQVLELCDGDEDTKVVSYVGMKEK